jgi:hypothetical protein
MKLNASGPSVRVFLLHGRRMDAADQAELLAESADVDALRELVQVLANELRNIGDTHTRKGRPTAELSARKLGQRGLAVRDYRAAIYARLLADGDDLSAPELSSLAWLLGGLAPEGVPDGLPLEERHQLVSEAIGRDLPAARSALKPYALALLGRHKLLPDYTPRRGYKATTLRKIAKYWSVSVDVLRRELAR